MSFLIAKRTLGFKLESPAYTEATLAVADYNVPAHTIAYDPEIAAVARRIARGDFSRDISVMGKRSITVTFMVDVAAESSGATTVAPTWFKCLQACGMLETVLAAGVKLETSANVTNVPATIEIIERDEGATPTQVLIRARGCMGNAKFVLDNVGAPVRIEFEFTGVLSTIEDRAFGSILNPTAFDSPVPDAVLSATVSAFGETQQIDTITVDLGNDVQNFTDPSKAEGWQGAHVVDREPTIEMDPDLETLASKADFGRWTGGTTGAFLMTIGDDLQFSGPAVQFIKIYAPGDREGHVTSQKTIELKRQAINQGGNDEFKILQGTE